MPVWSPDGEKIAFSNEELELVIMDAKSGRKKVVDTAIWEIVEYRWSPDSRFLTYSRTEENYNSTIWVWDDKNGKKYPVTNDFFNSHSPVFDPEGKYLFFLSDRFANPKLDWQEEIYILDGRTRPYGVCLMRDTESPFLPKADPNSDDDEEGFKGKKGKKGKGDKKGKKKDDDDDDEKEKVVVEIQFDGLEQRIFEIPVVAANYRALSAVKNNLFFMKYLNNGMVRDPHADKKQRGSTLYKYNIKRDKLKVFSKGIRGYEISADGKKIAIRKRDQFTVKGIDEADAGWDKGDKGDDDQENKNVDFSQWDMRVDVRVEWKQIFAEAWRLQRDFFWDPNLHLVDWKAVRENYRPLVDRISTRDELNDLIGEMLAELNCSHSYVGGGDQRRPESFSTGVLGIDASMHRSGYVKIDRIYEGREWQKGLSSPLAAPGVKVEAGEYIIEINGQSVKEVPNYNELLLNKAGKIITLSINDKPSSDGSREIVVKPLRSEYLLRHYTWVDNRRAYVEEKSDGKIGYIHLSNMMGRGLSEFTSSYLPQHQKPALIMDVRHNGGGFVAEMILSHLNRKMFSMGKARHGYTYRRPNTAFYGHMAAVCNGETGSDGETFTEGFKRLGLGKVIGTRTWGGWVGIRGGKPFVDRGGTTQPEFTGWGLDGNWLIEGRGTDPDIEVLDDPAAFLRGEDPQLDATIQYLLEKLEKEPVVLPEIPAYPVDRGH